MGTPYLCSSEEHKYGGRKLCKHVVHKFDQLFTANEQIFPLNTFSKTFKRGNWAQSFNDHFIGASNRLHRDRFSRVLLDRFKIVLRPYPTTLESREI